MEPETKAILVFLTCKLSHFRHIAPEGQTIINRNCYEK